MISRQNPESLGFVTLVQGIKTLLIKTYYKLTAYIPRRFPEDQAEWEEFREVMMLYFGLRNEHAVWITVAGQIKSTPATSLRKSYGSIANAAKRLQMNAIAHRQASLAMSALEVRLKEKMQEVTETETSELAAREEIIGAPA